MVKESARQEPLNEQEYDKRIKEYGWVGSEVAFGLAYEYTNPGQTILDVGIGTGLGSVLFHWAGMIGVYTENPTHLYLAERKGKIGFRNLFSGFLAGSPPLIERRFSYLYAKTYSWMP